MLNQEDQTEQDLQNNDVKSGRPGNGSNHRQLFQRILF